MSSMTMGGLPGQRVMIDLRVRHHGARQTLVCELVDEVGRRWWHGVGRVERTGDCGGRVGMFGGGRCSV